MWGTGDLLFNGYRLDARGGRTYSATTINVNDAVPEGSYMVEDASASNAFYQKRQTCSGIEYALMPGFQKNVTPRFYIVSSKTKYTGILAEPALASSGLSGAVLQVRYSAPWMLTAWSERGQREVSGPKANARILEYFQAAAYWGTDDTGAENAWCGSFVSWVMKKHGHTLPANAFRAKSWAGFGKTIKNPVYGATGVKSRKGGGHVAFVVGKDADGKYLYMLGGNQQNEVNISRYDRGQWNTFVLPDGSTTTGESLPIYTGSSTASGSEA